MGIPTNHPNMVPFSREAIGKPGNHDGEYYEYPRTLSAASCAGSREFLLLDRPSEGSCWRPPFARNLLRNYLQPWLIDS